jgi:hypothetical protein
VWVRRKLVAKLGTGGDNVAPACLQIIPWLTLGISMSHQVYPGRQMHARYEAWQDRRRHPSAGLLCSVRKAWQMEACVGVGLAAAATQAYGC